MTDQTKALWEAAKEGLRLALFAGLAALVQWVLDTFIPGLDPQYAVYTPILTFVFRLIDKWIHENTSVGPKWLREAKGLSPV